jgi:serine/threonine-protein kinase HipA
LPRRASSPQESGLRLAPIYDVVSTNVYPQIDRRFAIETGGQQTVEALHRGELDKFARSLGMRAPAIVRLGMPLLERTRGELDGVLHRVASDHEHHPILDEIRDLVLERAGILESWMSQAAGTKA